MKNYIRRKWVSLVFLSAVLIIGYASIPFPGHEIFPFYSWTMFSMVPGSKIGYTVYIHEVGGKPYNPPIEFQRADGLVGGRTSVVVYQVIQNLGVAYDANQADQVGSLRRLFEKNYLAIGTHWELVRYQYDPLLKWKVGRSNLPSEHMQDWVRTE